MQRFLDGSDDLAATDHSADISDRSRHFWGEGADVALEFGRFRLLLRQRQLLADGIPIKLGTRGFDLLLALLEADGSLVTKDELVMVAVIGVALLAALWRPVRYGAVLLAGAIVPLAAQAISAIIQATEPAAPSMFGISSSQAAASGLTISSGLTPIFWVYCVFVISLLISCAWMLTAPHYPAMPAAPRPPEPGPAGPAQSASSDADDDADDTDGGEDDEESSYA